VKKGGELIVVSKKHGTGPIKEKGASKLAKTAR
jgi:hypothetical protein